MTEIIQEELESETETEASESETETAVEEETPVAIETDVDIEALIDSANTHFEAAQQAQQDGDWATYGEELEALERDLALLLEMSERAP